MQRTNSIIFKKDPLIFKPQERRAESLMLLCGGEVGCIRQCLREWKTELAAPNPASSSIICFMMHRSNGNNQNNNNGSGTHPACASCKHQRKKCGEDCLLAPYFPANRSQEFQAVHKVFGVSNMMKLVRHVKEEERKLAVESLIWEALCRQINPVLGPLGEYRKLQGELNLCRSQMQMLTQNLNQMQPIQPTGGIMYNPTSGGGIVWNSTNGTNNNTIGTGGELANNSMNYGHEYGNLIIDANTYYPFYMQAKEKLIKEKISVGSQLLVPRQLEQQQHYN